MWKWPLQGLMRLFLRIQAGLNYNEAWLQVHEVVNKGLVANKTNSGHKNTLMNGSINLPKTGDQKGYDISLWLKSSSDICISFNRLRTSLGSTARPLYASDSRVTFFSDIPKYSSHVIIQSVNLLGINYGIRPVFFSSILLVNKMPKLLKSFQSCNRLNKTKYVCLGFRLKIGRYSILLFLKIFTQIYL